ncbi:UDP-N-acetylmuramate--L-alanine ligase, partial [Streptococcus danieliae]|nr:UDP-N-acetylmuramate--L-alanine ligase [Streptococcus danieliae]
DAFDTYADNVKNGLFIYGEDQLLRKITSEAPIYYYGFDPETNDFIAKDLVRLTTGSTFTVEFRGEDLGQFHIPTYGKHNVMNATAVIGLLHTIGFDLDLARQH